MEVEMKAQQIQLPNLARQVTVSSDMMRRQTMCRNLIRHNFPHNRPWAIGFARKWARQEGYDPDNFQALLEKTSVQMGFGTQRERQLAHELILTLPASRFDEVFRERARAVGRAHGLPDLAVDEQINLILSLRPKIP